MKNDPCKAVPSLCTAAKIQFEENLYINSRGQTPQLFIDNAEQMAELTLATKQIKAEFVLFDVFNVLHHADENDNTEMRKVMERLTQFQEETNASIGIVHHFNKNADERSLTQRLRGRERLPAGPSGWLESLS